MKPLFGFTVLLSCILLFACKKSHDSVQPPVTPPPSNLIFSKAYGGTDIENGGSIVVTSDGGFVLAGTTFSNNGDVSGNHGKSDVMIIRADSTGKKIWEKTIGGSDIDKCSFIASTTDGGFVITGITFSNDGDFTGNHGFSDSFVIKLDSNGNIIWKSIFGGALNDELYFVSQTIDGGYILTGKTGSNGGGMSGNHGSDDAWILRLDGSGNKLWQRLMGGSNSDIALCLQTIPDGSFVIGAYTTSINGDLSINNNGYNAWIFKLDANGNTVWNKVIKGNNNDVINSITKSQDGGFVFTGYSNSTIAPSSGLTDVWVGKIDNNGTSIWNKYYGGKNYEAANSIVATSDGNFVIAGYTNSNDVDVTYNHGSSDAWVLKVDANGNKIFQKTYGGTEDDYGEEIKLINNNTFITAGYTNSNNFDITGNHGASDLWVFKGTF